MSNRSTAVKRVMKDLKDLADSKLDTIFVHPNETNILFCDALIIGPDETPYQGGFFHFSIEFPENYPLQPPKVLMKTTNGGTVRFNPNLYENGKVCLSILGTWPGPSWTIAMNLGTVLLSIQSLMNKEPYKNEPGYENSTDFAAIEKYSRHVKYNTYAHAIFGMLDNPTCGDLFQTESWRYFMTNFQKIKENLENEPDYSGSLLSSGYYFSKLVPTLLSLKEKGDMMELKIDTDSNSDSDSHSDETEDEDS